MGTFLCFLCVIWNKMFLRMNKKTGRVLKILMKIIQLITPVNHLYILYTCIPYIINVYYIIFIYAHGVHKWTYNWCI